MDHLRQWIPSCSRPTFLKPESPYWEKLIGRRCVEALIGASIDKARYSKSQRKEVTQKLKKSETNQVIDAALIEVQGRRGKKSTYVLLEEMLPPEDATTLIGEIQKVLKKHKMGRRNLYSKKEVMDIFSSAIEGGDNKCKEECHG